MIEVSLPVYIALWLVVALVVIVTIVFLVRLFRRKGSGALDRDFIEEKKKRIETLIAGGSEQEWILGIIEADKLLDYMLKARQVAGTTLGERLKVASYDRAALKNVWEAHKVRNKLVHEHSVVLQHRDVKRYWRQYTDAYHALMR